MPITDSDLHEQVGLFMTVVLPESRRTIAPLLMSKVDVYIVHGYPKFKIVNFYNFMSVKL